MFQAEKTVVCLQCFFQFPHSLQIKSLCNHKILLKGGYQFLLMFPYFGQALSGFFQFPDLDFIISIKDAQDIPFQFRLFTGRMLAQLPKIFCNSVCILHTNVIFDQLHKQRFLHPFIQFVPFKNL